MTDDGPVQWQCHACLSPLRLWVYIWLSELLLKVAWQIINGLAASHFKHSWSAPLLAFKNLLLFKRSTERIFMTLLLNPQRIPLTGKLRQQIHQVYFQPQFIAESNKGQRFFGGGRVLKWNITCFHQSWLYRGICTFKKMQMRADPIEKSSAKV